MQARFFNNEQEFISHPWPQFLTQTGTGHHSGEAKDCKSDRHPGLEGWTGTENRQRDYENVGGEEVSPSMAVPATI